MRRQILGKLWLVGFVVLAIGLAAAGCRPSAESAQPRMLDGQPVSVEQFRGKPLVLNFWATWCPPCRAELPELERIYKDYKDRGIQVLAVARQRRKSSRPRSPTKTISSPTDAPWDHATRAGNPTLVPPTSISIQTRARGQTRASPGGMTTPTPCSLVSATVARSRWLGLTSPVRPGSV